jgi:hypothetical protein
MSYIELEVQRLNTTNLATITSDLAIIGTISLASNSQSSHAIDDNEVN